MFIHTLKVFTASADVEAHPVSEEGGRRSDVNGSFRAAGSGQEVSGSAADWEQRRSFHRKRLAWR